MDGSLILCMKYPFFPAPFVEKDILSPMNYLCSFGWGRNQLIIPLNFFFKTKTTPKKQSINYFKNKNKTTDCISVGGFLPTLFSTDY